ncbi:MAG: hypothetical protein KDJ37_12555 [Hyphomicrobiaceae bacterium]|nr:hypothetical protein [Hyphomicrobiaceae bacterium]
MTTSVPGKRVFRYSTARLAWLTLLGIVMAGVSAAVAMVANSQSDGELFPKIAGTFGAVFFGLCTLIILSRMFSTRSPAITLTLQGWQDTRIAPEVVPWSVVRSVSSRSISNQTFVVVEIDPAYERRLRLTRMVRLTRRPNAMLGFDGLVVNPSGLDASHEELYSAFSDYLAAASGR